MAESTEKQPGMEIGRESADDLIYLIAQALHALTPDPARVLTMDLAALYRLASFHQITALAAYALKNLAIPDDPFGQAYFQSVRRNILFDTERQGVAQELEKRGIWYMPLKGSVLKDLYPQIGMRQMSDNDILIDPDRADDVREIMEARGYTTVHFGRGHQDDYQKEPLFHFEMHRVLFEPETNRQMFRYYENIAERLLAGKGFERRFRDEDFYIYMIAHAHKHFCMGGTGLRTLVDIYVYLQKRQTSLDWAYIKTETEKNGVSGFEKKSRALAVKLFSDGGTENLTADENEMLDYFITSGTYGIREYRIQNSIAKRGKFRHFLQRVFLPMRSVRASYPAFYRHKILLPILPLYRLIRRRKNVGAEVKLLVGAKPSVRSDEAVYHPDD